MKYWKETELFKEWKQRVIEDCKSESVHWKTIGDWAYPTKGNVAYHEVFCHLCVGYKEKTYVTLLFNKCGYCGEKPSDGLKMIALLEKL